METKKVTNMLMDSAQVIHEILTNPNKTDLESKKILIASANTLAQTVKAMVQTEIIGLKLKETKGNTSQLIHSVVNGD